MIKKTDLAYLAGLIDADGCIRVKKSKAYKHLTGRVNPSYNVSIQVRMVDLPAIEFLHAMLGGWHYREKLHVGKGKPLFCWQATNSVAESVLKAILPYLRIKKEQANNALALRRLQKDGRKHRTKVTGYRNFPNARGTARLVENCAYSDWYIAQCEAFYARSAELNKVGV